MTVPALAVGHNRGRQRKHGRSSGVADRGDGNRLLICIVVNSGGAAVDNPYLTGVFYR
jgi:hypothetical protein